MNSMERWKPGKPVRLETPRFVLQSMSRLQTAWHTYPWTSVPEVMHPYGFEARTWSRRTWYRKLRKPNNRRRFCLGIWPKEETTLIGFETFELSGRDVASLSVMIGDQQWWGKAVVQETRAAILDFLFEKIGCVRVLGTPSIRNFPSIFNYQKLGFTCEGTLRKHGVDPVTKERVDYLLFSILRDEWAEKRKQEGTV